MSIKKLGRDALIGMVESLQAENRSLKVENAKLIERVDQRDEMITRLAGCCAVCIEHNGEHLRRVAQFGRRWALDSSYGIQEICNAVFPDDHDEVPQNCWDSQGNDWEAFNRYLHDAREHGKHDYQAGRKRNAEQYCKPDLRAAYNSGFDSEHEREGELL